ncbi:MAG: DUF2914 domain-containing protein, partial [Xanthomonadales bacterium]|nr:DUF2914 domain-containing protein [Xanthomonadales bacterium]
MTCRATALVAVLMACALAGCAALDRIIPAREPPAIEGQRAAIALAALDRLAEVDSVIRLDNEPLRAQIAEALQAQAALSGVFSLDKVRVRFARQLISLEANMQVFGTGGQPTTARIHGDVVLAFSGKHLVWLPRFDRIEPLSGLFSNPEDSAISPDLTAKWLERANREIADALIVLDRNVVEISPLPESRIEVGVTLANHPGMSGSASRTLGGVFTVAGAAIMIEPKTTSLALDLAFVPNISECPSDLLVSRSTFASEIRSREPIGISRFLRPDTREVHFFTEISGATRSTSVVHYWFANGKPVWLEELPVEPSYRWRTWSSRTLSSGDVQHWEVIVVEKQTGCILHARAIGVEPGIEYDQEPPPSTGNAAGFEQLLERFRQRTAGFSIHDQDPRIALIETRRSFLTDVIKASLADIRVVVNFTADEVPQRQFEGTLEGFDASQIDCAGRSCAPAPRCDIIFSDCIRQSDSRDCTRCLFRNPLNNRCVNEATDPICMAARNTQNEIFESRYQACLAAEARAQEDCQQLAEQSRKSCEIEATAELAACEAARDTVARFADRGPLARADLLLDTSGALSAIFSGFIIEDDLETLRMNLALSGALRLGGHVAFNPSPGSDPVASCIANWKGAFTGRVMLPYQANSLIGTLEMDTEALHTDWSGYVTRATLSPTPLEALFISH